MTKPHVTMLRDLVMIRPMPLHLKKTADGIILPGDVDKMAPKRATVVAAGPGTYDKQGKFVKNTCKVGDQVLYMERNLLSAKIDDEDLIILQQQDIILKIGKEEIEDDTLPELSDSVFKAESMRRVLISHLQDCGLTRVQDMINETETFISNDGNESIPVTARSFKVDDIEQILTYTPPEDAKAFSMYKVFYVETGGGIEIDPTTYAPTGRDLPITVHVMLRLAFLPRADVTLG